MDIHVEIKLERIFEVTHQQLLRYWIEPKHLKYFFVPKPCVLEHCDIDPVVGGRFNTVVHANGQLIYNQGIILQKDELHLVLTDSYSEGWIPNPTPFVTLMLSFTPMGEHRTLCQIIARHHAGNHAEEFAYYDFQLGWHIVLEQLTDYIERLKPKTKRISRRSSNTKLSTYTI
jgi:uncharacterized protein YndB with AHSA1/START domain